MRAYRLVALGLLVAGIGMVPASSHASGAASGASGIPDASGPELASRVASADVASAGAAASAAQEIDGLNQEVSMSYEIDTSAVVTQVSISVTLTNTTSNRVFESYGIPAPAEAANVSARTADGASLPISTEAVPETGRMKRLHVPLGSGLQPGQTRTVRLGYHLEAQSPRANTLSQANKAFFMFPLRPLGDPGQSSIDVRIPDSYEIEVVGSQLHRSEQGPEVVLSADGITNARDFFAVVVAMDESQLVSETVEVGNAVVELQGWPGDTEWIDFVASHVVDGVGVLEELIGEPWPTQEDLTIVETMTPVAQGYGGWYDPEENTIRIGNELDGHLVLHELSHVWINFDMFEERWLLEGFAEEYAYRTLEALGRPQDRSRPGPTPAESRLLPLTEWTTPTFGEDDNEDVEVYGYTTSWHVVGTIAEEIGMDALRDVVEAATDGTVTYRSDSEPEPLDVAMDWRRLLDLFENLGGSEQAADLFDGYVVDSSGREELTVRSVTRERYNGLAMQGGEWAPPFQVRRHMAEWEFDAALAGIAEAEAVLGLRDEIADALDGLEIGPLGLENDYELAADVGDVVSTAEQTLQAADAYRRAEQRAAGGSDLLESVGLWWSNTDGGLDDARTALEQGDPAASVEASRSVTKRLDHASRDGALRLGGATVVAGVGVALPLGRRRRDRSRNQGEPGRGPGQSLLVTSGPVGSGSPTAGPPGIGRLD